LLQAIFTGCMFGNDRGSLNALTRRPAPSWLQLFFAAPCKTLATTLYACRPSYSATKPADAVRVVCISDTHGYFPDVPEGDLLVHAGDLSQGGARQEIQRTLDWLKDLPHAKKVVIAGNHDLLLDPERGGPAHEGTSLSWHDLIYLQDSSISLRFAGGRVLNLYGSPWTRKHGNWAFEFPRGVDEWTHTFPDETDVLITHMPPFSHLDMDGLGDEFLLREVRRIRPKLHIFGHFHGGYGKDKLYHDSFERVYEAVMRRHAGFWGVLKMGCFLAWAWLGDKPQNRHHTVLVNAATVGGPRDVDVRKPITVQI
jgi:Calcineurin-like phosphoesterase